MSLRPMKESAPFQTSKSAGRQKLIGAALQGRFVMTLDREKAWKGGILDKSNSVEVRAFALRSFVEQLIPSRFCGRKNKI